MARNFECDKCESRDVQVRWIGTHCNTGPERLACKCKRCDYAWKEEPTKKEQDEDKDSPAI